MGKELETPARLFVPGRRVKGQDAWLCVACKEVPRLPAAAT